MPNTLGTLSGSLVIQEALSVLRTMRPLLNSFTTDFSAAPAVYNQAVISRIHTVPTIAAFGSLTGTKVDTDVPVTMNVHNEVSSVITWAEYTSTNRDLIAETAKPFAVALANNIIDTAAAVATKANFTTAILKPNAWDYAHLTEVRKTLAKAGVPEGMPKFYYCNSDVYQSLINDPTISNFYANQNNNSVITTGKAPPIAGFDIQEYPDMPNAELNLVGFAGGKEAIVIASRIPANYNEIINGRVPFAGNIGLVTDPETGLTVVVDEFINQTTHAVTLRMSWLFGVAKGNGAVGVRITNAAD